MEEDRLCTQETQRPTDKDQLNERLANGQEQTSKEGYRRVRARKVNGLNTSMRIDSIRKEEVTSIT